MSCLASLIIGVSNKQRSEGGKGKGGGGGGVQYTTKEKNHCFLEYLRIAMNTTLEYSVTILVLNKI